MNLPINLEGNFFMKLASKKKMVNFGGKIKIDNVHFLSVSHFTNH